MSEYRLDRNYNIKVFTETGNIYYVFANTLDYYNIKKFEHWLCESGSHSLFVSFTDEIFGGQCKNDRLGTINDFGILQEPTVCKRSRCTGCTTDLSMKKYSKE